MTDLQKHLGKEKREAHKRPPVFVDAELYYSSDLTYTEVHLRCKEIQLMKMIDISDLTIQTWYSEFLKASWDSKTFNKRAETIKNLRSGVDYFGNGIDISHWLAEDLIIVSRAEMEKLIRKRVEEQIFRGNLILQEFSQLFKIDNEDVKLAISRELTNEYEGHRMKLFGMLKTEAVKKHRKMISEKRGLIQEMNIGDRELLLEKAIRENIISKPLTDIEKEMLIENMEVFTDKLVNLL